MRKLTSTLHSLNLKAGIYTSVGATTTVYESKKDREARLKKEEEARIAAENNKGGDLPTRALTDMMNNTLEVKKEAITEESLVREEWMDEVPFEQMSEEQRKALDDYNTQAKVIAEALEKQRKAFELELKKLRSEVAEIIKAFDDKVLGVYKLRSAVQTVIQTQELYCHRLGLSIMKREDCATAMSEAEEKLAGLNVQKDLIQSQCNLGPLQAAMQEAQKMAAQGLWTSPKDPFLPADDARAKALRYAEVQLRDYIPLNIDDIPESFGKITDQIWDKLNDLRKVRFEKENVVQVQAGKLKEAVKQMDRSKEQLNEVEKSIEAVHVSFDLLVEQDGLDKKNIEVLTTFKQGQDAVEQGFVATDYGDAILIPLSIIESTNKEIRALGDDKVKVLTNTRNFRKRINYMTWEHEYLEDKAMNMDQHYTDFQFLRVSAQVKQVLSGVKTESDRAKMERAEMHLSKLHSTHKSKKTKLERENRKVAVAIKERLAENSRLEGQLKDLAGNVGVREAIYKSRVAASSDGGGSAASRKMKRVTMRRKLVDLARAQTDEIEFLRMELDRLRQKTFPSFANAARERVANHPDERDNMF